MFDANGKERKMFAEYYKICEKYWVPRKDDIYWKELINLTDAFIAKFQDIPGNLATKIAVDFIEAKEAELREASDD